MKRIAYSTFILLVTVILSGAGLLSCVSKDDGTKPRGWLTYYPPFTILCGGDLLVAEGGIDLIKEKGHDYPFTGIKDVVDRYDFFFCNLETPITSRGTPWYHKAYTLRLTEPYASGISALGLDVVSLSNNHIMDYGIPGLFDTLISLYEMGIRHTGAGFNLAHAREPASVTFGKTEVLFFSYCNRPPRAFYAGEKQPGTVPLDLEIIEEDLEKYKKKDNVLLLVSLHWGIEQTDRPGSYQKYWARRIIDAGADAIIGHHPHWPQGIEVYKGKPILYSLGNFINGYTNRIERDNILAALHVRNGELFGLEILPLAGKNREIKFRPHLMEGDKGEAHLRRMKYLSAELGTSMIIQDGRGWVILDKPEPRKVPVPF
jgi:poly-gamma-glutamate synthesis protein (capsule biosynthesis protein)